MLITVTVIIWIIGIILLIKLLFFLIYKSTNAERKRMSKDWVAGDFLKLKNSAPVKDYTILHKLAGWNPYNIYVIEDGTAWKCNWSDLEYNKSSVWRIAYQECEKFMGEKPMFNPHVGAKNHDIVGKTYYDKTIELMSEAECDVFLKKAIEEEKYEIAELIKKRLQNFK